MDGGIDFKSVTTGGVAQTKSERSASEMTERAKKAKEYSEIKSSMAPPKEPDNKAEKALKKLYIQQSVNKLSGREDAQEPTPQDLENERLSLIRKLSAYYTLPRYRDRPQLGITAKTSNEAIKAEIYDIENETYQAGPELALMALFKALEIAENVSDNGRNAFRVNLHGLTENASLNKDELGPIVHELAIKYSDYMPRTGVWGRLAGVLLGIGYHTHKLNTDPEYRKRLEAMQKAEARVAEDLEKALAAKEQEAKAAKNKK